MSTKIALFCMPEPGHFQLLRPLISGLVRHGAQVWVFTDRQFEAHVAHAGAAFVDLFAQHSLNDADDSSMPVPCRYVSFAGRFGEQIATEVRRINPALVIMETFALVGRVVATSLGIPWINVSPGHALDPEKMVNRLRDDPRVSLSPACDRAVQSLAALGFDDASPFSFVTSVSPQLNISCEPLSFVDARLQEVLEPLVHFGALPDVDDLMLEQRAPTPRYFRGSESVRLFVAFGTIVWRYFRNEAFAVLRAVADFVESRAGFEAVISLGNAVLDESEVRQIQRRNVHLETFVDQHAALREAGVFLTHHGINSTHEAIVHCVPMISYPFFWDQPALAARCQEMGIAVPSSGELRGAVSSNDVARAVDAIRNERDARRQRLERARDDELAVIANRDVVLERILSLAR